MNVARQMRLRQVGAAGQARLASAHVAVGVDGAPGDVARAYLARAGVGRIDAEGTRYDAAVDTCLAALGLRHAAATDVAKGALSALLTVRGVLEEEARS